MLYLFEGRSALKRVVIEVGFFAFSGSKRNWRKQDGVCKNVPAVLQQLSAHWVDNSCTDINNKGERTITESALERKLLMRKNCIS